MKILFLRHAQSMNNIIEETPGMSREKYEELRNHDPHITELGQMQFLLVAEYLKKQNLKINKGIFQKMGLPEKFIVFTSAMRRALESAAILRSNLKCDVEIMTDICEEGGLYKLEKVHNGISRSDVEKTFPGFALNEKEVREEGWFFSDHRETQEEVYERALKVAKVIQNLAFECIFRDLKGFYWKSLVRETDDVFIFISHGNFVNEVMRVLLDIDKSSSKTEKIIEISEILKEFYFNHENAAITCFEAKLDGQLYMNYFNYTEHLEDLLSKL